MTGVKICGLTRLEDAQLAAELGAGYLGVVLWPGSPRATDLQFVRLVRRTMPDACIVAVLVNPTARQVTDAYEAGAQWVQIHGDVPEWGDEEPPVTVLRARTLDQVGPAASREEFVLLDAHDPMKHGGTGRTIDWVRAAEVARTRNVFLAGGLTPANVAEAIRTVKPFAVDVASGVESEPGVKDPDKLRAFIAAAKGT